MPEKNNINERSNQRTIKMYAQNLKRETKNQEENETRNRFEAVTLSDAPILFFLILIFFLSTISFLWCIVSLLAKTMSWRKNNINDIYIHKKKDWKKTIDTKKKKKSCAWAREKRQSEQT